MERKKLRRIDNGNQKRDQKIRKYYTRRRNNRDKFRIGERELENTVYQSITEKERRG